MSEDFPSLFGIERRAHEYLAWESATFQWAVTELRKDNKLPKLAVKLSPVLAEKLREWKPTTRVN